jgi:hypothetical protein
MSWREVGLRLLEHIPTMLTLKQESVRSSFHYSTVTTRSAYGRMVAATDEATFQLP